MSSLRISFLVQDTGKIYGAQRATLDLLRALATHEHVTPVVVVMRESRRQDLAGDWLQALKGVVTRVEEMPVDRAFSPDFAARLGQWLVQEKMDILHAVGPKADLHAMLARKQAPGCAFVATVHGWLFRRDLKERLHEAADRFALRRMDAVIALSSFYKTLLTRQVGPRVVHIPSGFDPTGIAPASHLPSGPFRVGYLGRLSSEKNIDMLLSAASLMQNVDAFQFLIAGEGPDRAKLEARVAQDALAQVSFLGSVARDDVLSRIDVLVLCSRIENLPYAILEAMAAGLPVVATRVGGIPDLVEEGTSGFLVCSNDTQALAAHLIALSRDREQAMDLGQRGRRLLDEKFSPSACAAGHRALYERLVEGR